MFKCNHEAPGLIRNKEFTLIIVSQQEHFDYQLVSRQFENPPTCSDIHPCIAWILTEFRTKENQPNQIDFEYFFHVWDFGRIILLRDQNS